MSLADVARRHVSTSDGLKLQVVEGGNPSGPSILFVHGYLSSSDAFRRQFEGPLSKTHRLIAFDLRGHGGSEKPLDIAAYIESRVWADDVTLWARQPAKWLSGSRCRLVAARLKSCRIARSAPALSPAEMRSTTRL